MPGNVFPRLAIHRVAVLPDASEAPGALLRTSTELAFSDGVDWHTLASFDPPPAPSAPANTVAPAITGPTTVGGELSTTNGTWTGYPAPTFTYQWQLDGVDIIGATASTYTTTEAGDYTCDVTGSNSEGDDVATSNTIAVADAPATGWFGTKSFTNNPLGGGIDRAALDRFAMTDTGSITGIFLRSGSDSAAGAMIKGLIYADNAGAPGELLGVGAAVAVPVGASWFKSEVSGVVVPPGNYWLGAVMSDYQGTIDFGTGTGSDSLLWASGFSFATPPDPAPGSPDASYPVDLSVYAEYDLV